MRPPRCHTNPIFGKVGLIFSFHRFYCIMHMCIREEIYSADLNLELYLRLSELLFPVFQIGSQFRPFLVENLQSGTNDILGWASTC